MPFERLECVGCMGRETKHQNPPVARVLHEMPDPVGVVAIDEEKSPGAATELLRFGMKMPDPVYRECVVAVTAVANFEQLVPLVVCRSSLCFASAHRSTLRSRQAVTRASSAPPAALS
jgi:hypothetical protein